MIFTGIGGGTRRRSRQRIFWLESTERCVAPSRVFLSIGAFFLFLLVILCCLLLLQGCKIKKIEDWWQRRHDLTNVYTWTFSHLGVHRISRGRTADDAQRRQEAMTIALDTVAKFNLVMVMEWLAYAPNHVSTVLGFRDTSTLTTRVRPHITQFERNDGQEKNVLGAAGIAKASWTPKDYLSPEQYKIMSEDLALDEILTDAARRMFLERIVCKKDDFIEAA
jgi:hypothetical protein